MLDVLEFYTDHQKREMEEMGYSNMGGRSTAGSYSSSSTLSATSRTLVGKRVCQWSMWCCLPLWSASASRRMFTALSEFFSTGPYLRARVRGKGRQPVWY